MKILKLKFLGEFKAIDELIEEINTLGHEINYLKSDDAASTYDYVLFFDVSDFFEWIKKNKESSNKAVLCTKNNIILFKDENEGYELSEGSLNEVEVENLVDAVITLSQGHYSSWPVISTKTYEEEIIIKSETLLSPEDYQKIVYEWNKTDKEYPEEKTIHQLFEEQVERTPNQVAMIYEEKQLTYYELNARANQFAHYLREKYTIHGDDLIALYLDRSEYMLIAILAVLKAGAAYVPIDPNYPEERIIYILKDTQTKAVITNAIHQDQIANFISHHQWTTEIEAIDSPGLQKKLKPFPETNPIKHILSANLAYVIYTSGTTGQPKGVMVSHKSVVNLVITQAKEIDLSTQFQDSRASIHCLWYTNYVFDVHVSEVFPVITHGHTIHIVKNSILHDMELLSDYINLHQIKIAAIPPAILTTDSLLPLRTLIIGGEKTEKKVLEHYRNNQINIINAYGPSESTVCATLNHYEDDDLSSNIGKPIANITIYILDPNLNPLPVGVIGELYIGGIGLARGYLNLPDLTAERFIANPFQTEIEKKASKNSRLYKTGDLARYLSDGDIEFIGRSDFQIKIHGLRIEPGEIESKLVNYPEIKQAVVVAKEHHAENNSNKYLIGYYVADSQLEENAILDYLHSQLPDYMVPSILIRLDKLPLTINGKVDLRALPEPESSIKFTYIAPRNDLDHKLCEVYAVALGLPTSKVGIKDDFFKLGGNSLAAMLAVSRLSKEFTEVKLEDFYQFRNVESLSNHITLLLESNAQQHEPIHIFRISDELLADDNRISNIQNAIYVQSNLDALPTTYNVPVLLRMRDVDVNILEEAIKFLFLNNRILKIRLVDESHYKLSFDEILIRKVYLREEDVAGYANESANYIFTLDGGLLICAEIAIIDKGQDVILNLTHHHILTDAQSVELLIAQLLDNYNKIKEGADITEASKFDYLDYIPHQYALLQTPDYKAAINKLLVKFNKAQPIQLSKITKNSSDNIGEKFAFEISTSRTEELLKLAANNDVSLYTLLLTMLYHVLQKYNFNDEQFPIGTTVSNRRYDFIKAIGPFISSLPVMFDYSSEDTILDNLRKVNDEIIFLNQYADINLNNIVNLSPKKSDEVAKLMQIMFTMHNFKDNEEINISKNITRLPDSNNAEQFGISVVTKEYADKIIFNVSYLIDIYDKETVASIFKTYHFILNNLEQVDINRRFNQLKLFSNADFYRLVYDWNKTAKDYPANKTIHQLFEEQVERTPDHIAVVYEDQQLSYRELNAKANQLGHYLQQQYHLQADDLVALCLDRSEQMLIAILAVLKAGAAYVPMDPAYPDERITYVLEDTAAKLCLTNKIYQARLADIISKHGLSIPIEVIDSDELQSKLNAYQETNRPQYINSTNLAYVIYTSGTTGQPKGVMIEHKSVINLIQDVTKRYDITASDKVLLFANYVFDASVEQIFITLLSGAQLYICDENTRYDSNLLESYCIDHKITHLNVTPTYAVTLGFAKMTSLRRLILAGDVVSPELFKQLCDGTFLFINEYGPTETCVTAVQSINENYIGKPIANTTVYILDTRLNPVPIGVIGELYIGGAGLAREYLNLPELTAERFISNPFQSDEDKKTGKNERLYKTGDLVRYLPNGNIDYIGRNDFQVKIRGFRIELGEIETKLSYYPDIKQSVVLAKSHLDQEGLPTGNKYLVGYYVANNPLDHEAIIYYLSLHLPDYMVPTALVWLDKLPLTISGKLDRNALPDPEWTSVIHYVAPRNELESQVCAVYANVLGLPPEQVGIRDDFFRLGGDSIHSIQLVSRLRQRLGLKVTVKDIFAYKTIEKLYNQVLLGQLTAVDHVLREEGLLSGDLGLLPIQSWFFQQVNVGLFKKPAHWNHSFLIKTPPLDHELLKQSLIKLIEYHDAFRLHYLLSENGEYQQYYAAAINETELELFYINVSGMTDNECQAQLTHCQDHFELTGTKPLFRIGYLEGYFDGSCRLFFALHHLLIDAVSWRIITHDLQTIYDKLLDAQRNNQLAAILQQSSEILLGSKGTSYRQWVEQINHYNNTDMVEKQYWQTVLADRDEVEQHLTSLALSDNKRLHAELRLDHQQTRLLLTQCGHAYHTEINDLLLTALGLALATLTQYSHHYISLEGHGREEIIKDTDVSHTVGWFTTMYPVKLVVESENMTHSIIRVKEVLRSIPNKGIGYGALFGYVNIDLPKISFNYLGQLSSAELVKKDWFITGEPSGLSMSSRNEDNSIINILGAVNDGELRFSITAKLSEHDLRMLVDALKQQLLLVIEHTSQLKRSYLTASDVDNIISQSYLDKLQAQQPIRQVYLANNLQQGFIYHALNQGDEDTAYRVQLVLNYHNHINPELLQMAWQGAIKRYPSLRLRFAWDEELVQIIDEHQDLIWQYLDLSHHDTGEQESLLKELIRKDRNNAYHLEEGHLLRVFLIKRSEDNYSVILSSHHAILDGWSNPLLLDFVHQLYLQLKKSSLQQRQSIITAIQEEETYLQSQRFLQRSDASTEVYWQQQLAKIEDYPDLTGLLRQDQRDIKLADYRLIIHKAETGITLNESFYQKIKIYSATHGVTINALLQYGWHKLLSAYGYSQTTIVGTTISGRNLPIDHIEQSVGLYINTLPLIVQHDNTLTIVEELQAIQTAIHELNSYSNMNLAKLQPAGRRLFDSLFVYENYPTPKQAEDSPIRLSVATIVEELDYPLAIVAYEQNDQIKIAIKYAGELFSKETISTLLDELQGLLNQIITGVEQSSQLTYLSDSEYKKIIQEWNKADKNYPAHKTIHQLFEEQVERTADHIAVVYEDQQLSYRELNAKANQLAHYLQQQYHLQADDLVALCLDRSEQMLIAILAVLKAGAAYVPMDPGYPDERIAYILEDTAAKLCLTNEVYQARLTDTISKHDLSTPIEAINSDELQSKLNAYQETNLPQHINSNNLAYVIYTSGTTGKPKGVLQQHRNVHRLFSATDDWYHFNSQDVWTLFHAYVFDFSVWEIWGALCYGGKLLIPNYEQTRDIKLFYELCEQHGVTVLNQTPSVFYQFIDFAISAPHRLSSLRYVIFGGEPLNLWQLQPWFNVYGYNKPLLVNMYGITETTVHVTYKPIAIEDLGNNSYIGGRIPDQNIYIVNAGLNPLPVGAIGEMYIGGAGLARGYLNLPDLTAERFIANPFQSAAEKQTGKNAHLYKTGDLARYLPDGSIEYIGRNDFQVKIRGYRIELGEIENILLSYPEIKQAVVLAREHQENQGKYLVGYYVAQRSLAEYNIIDYLHSQLPEYMVPSVLVHLEQLPLTINGKLDRKALPDPEFGDELNYVEPRNDLERMLCKIYAEVLGLSVERVGINDNFFRLGGDSIIAIRLVSKMNTALNSAVKVKDIFNKKTVGRLSDLIQSSIHEVPFLRQDYKKFSLLTPEQLAKIDLGIIEDSYPASYLQMGMLLESELDEHNAYHDVFSYKLSSNFKSDKFFSVWNKLIAKHELLRARFITASNGYNIEIAKTLSKDYELFENKNIDSLIAQERVHDFDFTEFGLFRLLVNKLDDGFDLIFSSHHAITDGWSEASLINEFVQEYVHNSSIESPEFSISYGEFVKDEQNAIKDVNNIKFWKDYLQDVELPNINWNFSKIKSTDGLFYSRHSLTGDKVSKVIKKARELSIGVDTIFLHAYVKTLSQFFNRDDVTLGLVVNNRPEFEGGDKLFGLFLNTIPFRFKVNKLRLTTEDIFEEKLRLYEYKRMPYGYIKSMIGHELYEFAYNFIHFHIFQESMKDIIDLQGYARTNIPCVLNVSQRAEEEFNITLVAHDDFIEEDYLNYLMQYFIYNLDLVLDGKISESGLLSKDYNKLIIDWNKTDKDYPADKTIHQLFEEQVERTPDHIAVVYEDQQLNYRELNAKANQLAHYLQQQYHLQGDDLIALCIDRSEQMLIAILAVLKVGAAYVPMDPGYPDERIAYVLEDTSAKLCLASEIYQARLADIITKHTLSAHIEAIDSDALQNKLSSNQETNLPQHINSTNLAYVIYTSGTTGKPKGVMIGHRSVVNLALMQAKEFGLTRQYENKLSALKCLCYANYVFDAHVWELFTAIINGHTTYIVNDAIRQDVQLLSEYINLHKINVALIPPALLTLDHLLLLNTLVVGGDKTEKEILEYYKNNQVNVINAYGPTESTVYVTLNHYRHQDLSTDIGRPITNVQIYILDEELKPLPIGVIGELYIGGVGLARGYLNLPDLTAERFIINPFQSEIDKKTGDNARLYKTGDLARYLPDGNIEYLGRNDFQVKIRGFRIELGEIENKLLNYPEINQAAVSVKEHAQNRSKYLVGYYVANNPLDENSILDYLRMQLPDYMVPNVLIYLDQLPLTINGKLDRNALPDPEFSEVLNYVAPSNDLERQICEIYAQVLGLSAGSVGIRDDFFRLGGDSIISIQLVSRIRRQLELTISVKDIFAHKTVEKLCENVLAEQLVNAANLPSKMLTENGVLSGEVDFLPIQDWFFSQVSSGAYPRPGHWNQAFLIKTGKLDQELLKHSLVKLIEYHDAFRLNYRLTAAGNYQQYYSPAISFDVLNLAYANVSEFTTSEYQELLTDWQSHFELLAHRPLYQIGYLEGYPDGSSRIFFALHHLLVDTVSWRIIAHDLRELYEKLSIAQSNNELDESLQQSSEQLLGRKGTSYRQWVEQVQVYAETQMVQRSYWREELSGLTAEERHLIALLPNEDSQSFAEMSLDKERTRQLLADSGRAYHTEINDLLLTAFGRALAQLTQQQIHYIYITLEGHGREEIAQGIDITHTVGWFTTMYPLKLAITVENISQSIVQVKESLRKIPHKGIGYGALLGYSHQDLPRVTFNYLGQFDASSKDESNWMITGEPSGMEVSHANIDNNIINANGAVYQGELRFGLMSKLTQNDLDHLLEAFKRELLTIIKHTVDLPRAYLTTSDIDFIISQSYLDKIQAQQEITHVYLANSLQQGFIYHTLNQGEIDTAYRVQFLFNYENSLEPELLRMAWQGALKKYPSLRLRFAWDEELVQIIDQHQELYWQYSDISAKDPQQQEHYMKELVVHDRQHSYHLDQGQLLRIHLLKRGEASYSCLFSSHHAILDGWSSPLLLDFVHDLYLQLYTNRTNSALQVRILANIQEEVAYLLSQAYLQTRHLASENYWRMELANIIDYPDLTGLLRLDKRDIKLAEYHFIVDKAEASVHAEQSLYQSIKAFSYEHGITVNALLQYSWHKLLSVYGNSQTTVVGTTISGRNLPIDEIESSVGLYINTLPLVINHKGEETIIEQIKILQNKINEMNSHSDINLAKLQSSGRRLFDSLFIFENYPVPQKVEDHLLKLSGFQGMEALDYPLAITAYEQEGRIQINLKYAAELFSVHTIETLLSGLESLLYQITVIGVAQQNELSYLNAADYQKMIQDWNQTDRDYPADKTLHQLFEEQVEKTPDHIALVYEKRQLTYRELNTKANQLAHYLQQNYQLQGDDLIALCLDRSEQLLIAILAVLKAGAAYVPMDPSYPDERIAYILEDTAAKMCLTNEIHQAHLADIISKHDLSMHIEAIDGDELQSKLNACQETNLPQHINSNNLAYVIYTSGTTGKPKGVLQQHRNVHRLLLATDDWYHFNSQDVWTLFHAYVFDVSVWEMWGALCHGGKLLIPSYEQTRDIKLFYELCEQYGVTVLNQTPSVFYQFIDFAISAPHQLKSLRYIIFAGEALNFWQLQPWFNVYGYTKPLLVNMYGITETTVHVTYKPITAEDLGNNSYIGKPIPDQNIYIVDASLKPLPIGAIGEMYIGGAGLARGYLNLPDLTAERFIANPFQSVTEKQTGKNARLYKTGDLARYLADGSIEYIGRNDFQVKIRGFRIELGEIEVKLSSYPEIKQAAVLAREHLNESGLPTGNKYLVGYYVANTPLDHDAMHNYLSQQLPDYMIPSALVWLDKLPLTINGKLDRKALPDPEFISTNHYIAPRNELEKQIAEVYAAILGLPVDKISMGDDFFRLGGDSISSIQLSSRLRQLNINCGVKDIFIHRTVEKLAQYLLESTTQSIEIQREQGLLAGTFDLLPIQQWFFDQVSTGQFKRPWHWNQSFLIRVPELDEHKLESCIAKLVEQHDILRVIFNQKENEWSQSYQRSIAFPGLKRLHFNHQSSEQISQQLTLWQSEFDLAKGPLFQIGYISGYPDGSARIYFALHHLIVDTVSWRILTDDIHKLYKGEVLANKASSYRQWVKVVELYPLSHKPEADYWNGILDSLPNYSKNEIYAPELGEIKLPKNITQQLLQKSNQAYHTEINDLLLTALAYALKDWQGFTVNGITLEGHGREHIDESIDHSNTVGWFTIMYPVKLELQDTVSASIKHVKESLRLIPHKGLGYGSFSVLENSSIAFNKLPPIRFNYLGQFDKQEGDWQISLEDSGLSMHQDNQDSTLINISGYVSEGQLHFSIVTGLGKKITRLLTTQFEYHLKNIIEHCITVLREGEQENTPSDFANFIPFEIVNEDVNEDPLFIFPPGHGGAESYYNILLPKFKNRKLVLFNNFVHHVKDNQLLQSKLTFEELAKYYILQLQKIQPKGPYNLLGWSFGGVLAFEITRQLKQSGHAVSKLILLDSYFNYKKAMHAICKDRNIPEGVYQDINYKYDPKDCSELFEGTEITLVKANIRVDYAQLKNIIPDSSQEVMDFNFQLHQYYANTSANNLDNYVSHFKIYTLDCHHYNILEKISSEALILQSFHYKK